MQEARGLEVYVEWQGVSCYSESMNFYRRRSRAGTTQHLAKRGAMFVKIGVLDGEGRCV